MFDRSALLDGDDRELLHTISLDCPAEVTLTSDVVAKVALALCRAITLTRVMVESHPEAEVLRNDLAIEAAALGMLINLDDKEVAALSTVEPAQ